tara:strand:- start:1103 stop:1330 length:228 start_codon:yes stop_codon:yes gene_type:complete
MTKKVTDKAFELLAKAVSDLEGNEKKVADALIAELRVNSLVLGTGSVPSFTGKTASTNTHSLSLDVLDRGSSSLH